MSAKLSITFNKKLELSNGANDQKQKANYIWLINLNTTCCPGIDERWPEFVLKKVWNNLGKQANIFSRNYVRIKT
jgi:hypothetical protein